MDDPWSAWRTLAGLAPQFGGNAASIESAAERFARAARDYMADTAAAAQDRAATEHAARRFGDVLREQSALLFRPPWTSDPGFGAAADRTQKIPPLGLTREHQLRLERAAEAAWAMGDAQRRLQSLWSDTLRDAVVAFAARVATAGSAGAGAGAETPRALYDTWIDCAETAYARTAHSEPFCCALADFVNAGSQWRRECAAVAEHASKWLDLPTRSEIDSLTRRLACVERQLRAPPAEARAATQTRRNSAPRNSTPPRKSTPPRRKRAPKS